MCFDLRPARPVPIDHPPCGHNLQLFPSSGPIFIIQGDVCRHGKLKRKKPKVARLFARNQRGTVPAMLVNHRDAPPVPRLQAAPAVSGWRAAKSFGHSLRCSIRPGPGALADEDVCSTTATPRHHARSIPGRGATHDSKPFAAGLPAGVLPMNSSCLPTTSARELPRLPFGLAKIGLFTCTWQPPHPSVEASVARGGGGRIRERASEGREVGEAASSNWAPSTAS